MIMPLQSVQVYNILRPKGFSDEEAQLMAGAYEHKVDTSKIREDMEKMEGSLKGDISKVRVDMLSGQNYTIMWLGTAFLMSVIVFAVLTLMGH